MPDLSTTTRADAVVRMREITTELEKLAAHDKLTRAQELRGTQLQTEFTELSEHYQALDREEELQLVRDAYRSGELRIEGGDGASAYGNRPRLQPTLSREGGEARRAIDAAARSGMLPDHAAEKATRLVEQGSLRDRSIAARWATTTGSEDYLRAFAKLAGDPVRGHLLWTSEEHEAYRRVAEFQAETRAMSLTDASGGYMVPLTLDPAIMLTSAGSINPLRRIARVVQTATDQWSGVTSAGVTSEWKAEAGEVADASPTLANPNIPVHFGDAFVPYSFEVGMDAVNFVQELQTVLVDGADQLMNTAYTLGTGTGQPKGVIVALTGVSEVAAATADVFAKADVYNVQNALPARFSARAQWTAHIAIINLMAQMETTAGARLFPEIGDGRLLNKPLNELSNMDGTIAAGVNLVLLYGDFQAGFVIVDRIGTTLEFISNLVGANRRPTGQRGALLWFRTGSDVVVPQAFKLLNV
jgi:HK97 family phage major capsid protein